MRKVIPYIASQFRKDKIWLRRTKPSKRQYQIMLAVDDSSSMNDNHSKQVRRDYHVSNRYGSRYICTLKSETMFDNFTGKFY